MQVIGISGYARCGKDLFSSIATKILETEYNKKCITVSLANYLKEGLNTLINNTGVKFDFFTTDNSEKQIARPLMVAYGNFMRNITNNTFWTIKLEKTILSLTTKPDVIFIPDIRYNTSANDECSWLLNKMHGKLIHITKYTISKPPNRLKNKVNSKEIKIYHTPPNDYELVNDPHTKKVASICIEWKDGDNMQNLYDIVKETLKNINIIS